MMKTCPNCGAQVDDAVKFCSACGYSFIEATGAQPQGVPVSATAPQPQYQQTPPPQPQYQQTPPPQPQYQQAPPPQTPLYAPENPCDKALGIVAVLCGFLGVLVAYFGGDVNGKRSDYLRFYANEGLVLALFALIGLIPIIGWIWSIFNFVCMIIAVVYACKGETRPVLFYGTLRIIK